MPLVKPGSLHFCLNLIQPLRPAVHRTPPLPPTRTRKGRPPKVEYPEDELIKAYYRKNPQVGTGWGVFYGRTGAHKCTSRRDGTAYFALGEIHPCWVHRAQPLCPAGGLQLCRCQQ